MGRLEKEDALGQFDGDEALYSKTTEYFLKNYTDYPVKIKEYIKNKDRQAYVLTHSLKNIAASVGATELSARAFPLEKMLKIEDFASVDPLLDALLEEFTPVLEEILNLYGGASISAGRSSGGVDCWDDFNVMLDDLILAMGSFSPDKVGTALDKAVLSLAIVPEIYRERIMEILDLAREFLYLDSEDLLLELKKEVLE
jgi:HPt (histidine-containing phosphotransfer) domain-containing protein